MARALKKVKQAFDTDAVEIGDLWEDARKSFVGGVYSLLECGARLNAKKESLKHGEWLPWIEANKEVLGFTNDRTARKLIAAANRPSKSDLTAEEALAISRQMWGNDKTGSQLIQQSTSNEHYTPAKYIDAARQVMGVIDLDPASCPEANDIVGANSIYTKEDDGLGYDWKGSVWLNPPYGREPGPAPFISKLYYEIEAGNVTEAIVLVNAHCTDTEWFQTLWLGTLCFTDHRIDFYGDDDRSGSTHGSVFVYFGKNKKAFVEAFAEHGVVVERISE